MAVPSKEFVQQVLAKHDRDLICRRAVEAGWKAVKEKHPDLAWWRRKATRAGVMWENTIDSAISLFAGVPGVKHIGHLDTASFVIDDVLLARFKVAGISLLTSNYPTPLALAYDRHQRDLFGFRGLQRIEIVHVLNRFGTGLEWVGIVARQNRRVTWDYELRAAGELPVPLPLPQPQPKPAAATVLRPLKPKADEEKKKEDKESE